MHPYWWNHLLLSYKIVMFHFPSYPLWKGFFCMDILFFVKLGCILVYHLHLYILGADSLPRSSYTWNGIILRTCEVAFYDSGDWMVTNLKSRFSPLGLSFFGVYCTAHILLRFKRNGTAYMFLDPSRRHSIVSFLFAGE